VDQSSLDFFTKQGKNHSENANFPILDIPICSGDNRSQIWSCPKLRQI